MNPSTKAGLSLAASMHAAVYEAVRRLPAELISASRRSPRACGGGPSSSSAFSLSCGSPESSPMDSECIRLAGCRGDVGSNDCDMVVVAVVRLPALPFLLVCENRVCGGLALVLKPDLVGDGTAKGLAVGAEVVGVGLVMVGCWSKKSTLWVLSREVRGVPAVIMVSTD